MPFLPLALQRYCDLVKDVLWLQHEGSLPERVGRLHADERGDVEREVELRDRALGLLGREHDLTRVTRGQQVGDLLVTELGHVGEHHLTHPMTRLRTAALQRQVVPLLALGCGLVVGRHAALVGGDDLLRRDPLDLERDDRLDRHRQHRDLIEGGHVDGIEARDRDGLEPGGVLGLSRFLLRGGQNDPLFTRVVCSTPGLESSLL